MNTSFTIAKQSLLEPANLDEQKLAKIVDGILSKQVDFADLYFQSNYQESWSLEDGIVKVGSHSLDRGVGIRAVSGEKVGFAYTDDIMLASLEDAASAAKSIAKIGKTQTAKALTSQPQVALYSEDNPLSSLYEADKIKLLRDVDQFARAMDSRVKQVMANLSGSYEIILITASDGTLQSDVRPLVRLNVTIFAEQHGRREQGSMGGGGRFDYKSFLQGDIWKKYTKEAVRQALVNLDSVEAPAGMMPVVLAPGWPGVLLHEAVGHGLEGDFNRKKSSVFSGRIGEKVASDLCTIVDDGTIEKRRGSLTIDDEGNPSSCTTLIENGVLKQYMQDKLNARLMNMPATGNGRRESYAHTVLPRMTNTYMLPGKHKKEEIIASVEKGIYAVNFAGGQVDITSGQFVFSASEAYLIEKGKITQAVKGATLIGSGIEVLNNISMVADDLALDSGVGVCGKEGQSVPVGVGQPTVKIDALTVGGTKGA